MALDTEDRTDISGSPPPVRARSPQQVHGDTVQKVNQNRRGPQVQQGAGGGIGGFFSGLGSKAREVAGDVQQGAEQVSNWPFSQGFAHPTANPIDWPGQIKQDAASAWAFARHGYGVLSGRYHDGIHALYAGDDIRSRLLQEALNTGGEANPFTAIPMALNLEHIDSPGDLFDTQNTALARQRQAQQKGQLPQLEQQEAQRRKQAQEQAAQDLPGATAQLGSMFTPVGGELTAARAALTAAGVAAPMVDELLSGDIDRQHSALAWMAVGSLLSFGHVPAPLRKVLQDRFGNWGEVEKSVQDGLDAKETVAQAASDPEREQGLISADIKQKLDAAANDPLRAGLHTLVDKMEGEPDLRDPAAHLQGLGSQAVRLIRISPEEIAKKVAATVTSGTEVQKVESGEALKAGRPLVLPWMTKPEAENAAQLLREAGFDPKSVTKGYGSRNNTERNQWVINMDVAGQDMIHNTRQLQQSLENAAKQATTKPAIATLPLTGSVRSAAEEHLHDLSDVATEVLSKLWATHEEPYQQIGMAIAGHGRSSDSTFENYFTSRMKMLGGKVTRSREVAMFKAAEGDIEAYQALSPAEKIAVDSHRIVAGVLREMGEDTIYARNFVANWVPRLDEAVAEVRGRGRPGKAATLAREARRHRAVVEQVDAAGNPRLVQKYPTVQATNQALRAAREELTNHLLDPAKALKRSLAGNPEAAAVRRLVHQGDLEGARARATRMATDTFPLKSEDFLDSTQRVLPYQAKAIMVQKGLNELAKTLISADHPTGGKVIRAGAVNINGKRQRDIEQLVSQGYQHIDDPKFRGFVFDAKVAGMLNRLVQQSPDLGRVGEAASNFNKQLLRITMYSPHIHGLNIARRMGALALNHPIEFARFLGERKQPFAPLALTPAQKDDAARELRRFAHQSGVQPPRGAKGWLANFSDTVGSALGDTGDHVHDVVDPNTRVGKMMNALPSWRHPYKSYEDGFWRWVSDFGVMAFHVEHRSLIHGGMEEAKARALAAKRANSWMGMVLPEDSSPLFQKLSKLALFAPNWWRTLGELMVPIYRNSGIFEGPQDVRRAVGMGLKAVGGMYATMKISGELMNHMLSGHSQAENQPGHQDDVEIRNPAVLHALQAMDLLPQGVDPNTGINPKTGAHMYLRIGGQFEDVLQAAGLESGHEGHHIIGPLSAPGELGDVQDGMTRFAAARLSPLMSFVPGLANVDVYRTLTQGGSPRALVPGTQAGQVIPPNPMAVMLTAMQSIPGGQGLSQLIQQNQSQNGADSMSLFGTRLPTSLGEYTKALKVTGLRAALTGSLGVNPPYASAERTRGTAVPDADYQKVRELTDTYNRQNQTLGAEMFSGQKTPSAWLKQHRNAALQHSAQMKALFHNAPEYMNGSSGMANEWESLYDKATNPDGTLDQAKLSELQAQFRSNHTADEMRAMQSDLRQGDSKNPALALYHHTLDAADKWEAQWATQQGLDITTLRKENSEYNRLGTADRRKYLQQHGELRRLRTAIQRQFYRTPQGMLYALYKSDNQTVMRYLKAHHLTTSQLESEAEQQEQQAAA